MSERRRILLAAQSAARAGDHARARELFAKLGIGYLPSAQVAPIVDLTKPPVRR